MTLLDFTKQPRGMYPFDFWVANRAIPTSMGEFTVELQMGIGDKAPPDDKMLREADELVELLQAHIGTIHDKVFEHYQTRMKFTEAGCSSFRNGTRSTRFTSPIVMASGSLLNADRANRGTEGPNDPLQLAWPAFRPLCFNVCPAGPAADPKRSARCD